MVVLGRKENCREKVREKDFYFSSENRKPVHPPFPFLVLHSLSIKEAKVVNIYLYLWLLPLFIGGKTVSFWFDDHVIFRPLQTRLT